MTSLQFKMKYSLKNIVGLVLLCVLSFQYGCNDGNATDNASQPQTKADVTQPKDVPKPISWDIVKIYPHDPAAFTEGLEFRNGFLYESTGEYGHSELRKVDPMTGKVLQTVKLENHYFGEGITIINNKIFQLTYREGKGFIYDLATLKKSGTFEFHTTEGWGMTTNGSQMIFDDGSNVLHFIEPGTFREIKTLQVTDENGRVDELNELEMIKGYLYANVWKKDVILKIDTTSGKVIGIADLGTLRQRAGIQEVATRRGDPEVMNGIAYDPAGNRIFITGKNWQSLIEIRLDN